MKRVVFFILTITALMILSGTTALAASNISIDTENSEEGYISVKFNTGSTKKIKLMIMSGDTKYYYNLSNSEEYVNFPLQMGNGSYRATIYENTSGTKYRKLTSKSFMVKLNNENDVYLNSIQEVDFDDEDGAVLKAQELADQALAEKVAATGDMNATLTDSELIELYYNFVVQTIRYDYEKIQYLDYSYLPDNDATLATESGICYDYSSLLASMLRSQGVPTKLVKGYTSWTSVYHAWNEIYLASEDRWVIVDTTYDSYLYLRNRDYTFEKSLSVYSKTKEF
jgi:transglutaminase-like putative cysteine protease